MQHRYSCTATLLPAITLESPDKGVSELAEETLEEYFLPRAVVQPIHEGACKKPRAHIHMWFLLFCTYHLLSALQRDRRADQAIGMIDRRANQIDR